MASSRLSFGEGDVIVYAREPGDPVGHREYLTSDREDAVRWIQEMAPSFVDGTLLYLRRPGPKLPVVEAWIVRGGKAVPTEYVSYKDWS